MEDDWEVGCKTWDMGYGLWGTGLWGYGGEMGTWD